MWTMLNYLKLGECGLGLELRLQHPLHPLAVLHV